MTDRPDSAAADPDVGSDPYARPAQTFPHLADDMAGRIRRYGEEERFDVDDTLFRAGDRGVDFFLITEGAVAMIDTDAHGAESVVTTHHARQFTGELDLFNEREVLVGARVVEAGAAIRVPRAAFRRMVSAEPDIGEIILRAFILRRVGMIQHAGGGAILIGSVHAAHTQRIQSFLTRNGYPHRLLDTDVDPDARSALDCFEIGTDALPVVVAHGHTVLRRPDNATLADALGLTERFDADRVYDVAVVGAGPAGLAAAVYAASEGLDTIVIEAIAPGGQAGTSSRIENYLGFPTGISGQALAGRAQVQAQKFGARLAVARPATGLECGDLPFRLTLEGGDGVAARCVVVATGARYRALDVADHERFEGQGIHYAATALEGKLCVGGEVVIVGGGNSAGQAAMFLSGKARHVHILVRGPGLAETMSDYLVQRIGDSERITLHPHSEISALAGDAYLERVTWRDNRTGAEQTRDCGNLFLMIGAVPNTDWLNGCIALDDKGFVVTGHAPDGHSPVAPYATSRPGIYAVGDVRAGSVKRVASGVGEGSVVVQSIHGWLAEGDA
jgi:thioredoxin reductase (NADPH)